MEPSEFRRKKILSLHCHRTSNTFLLSLVALFGYTVAQVSVWSGFSVGIERGARGERREANRGFAVVDLGRIRRIFGSTPAFRHGSTPLLHVWSAGNIPIHSNFGVVNDSVVFWCFRRRQYRMSCATAQRSAFDNITSFIVLILCFCAPLHEYSVWFQVDIT